MICNLGETYGAVIEIQARGGKRRAKKVEFLQGLKAARRQH